MNATLILALPDLAAEIDQAHGQAVAAAGVAIDHGRRCGELLHEAKERIGHGGFLDWLNDNCQVKERQARNYMRVAANWPLIQAKSAPGADLTVKGALRLIGPTRTRPDDAAPVYEPLPEGFEPTPGRYLYGQHRLFEFGFALTAESAKNPGYWHVYILDGRPRPNGGGADLSSIHPVSAQHLAGMFHHFLKMAHENLEGFDWTIAPTANCTDGYPGKFVDDMAGAAYYHANYWWKGGGR